jgi:ribosomal protein S19E (S16A)
MAQPLVGDGSVSDLEKWRSIGVIRPATRAVNAAEAQLGRDRDAYRRLRANGLQPGHVKGSRHLEQHATLEIEVEMGWIAKSKQGKALAEEGVDRCYELGLKGPQ